VPLVSFQLFLWDCHFYLKFTQIYTKAYHKKESGTDQSINSVFTFLNQSFCFSFSNYYKKKKAGTSKTALLDSRIKVLQQLVKQQHKTIGALGRRTKDLNKAVEEMKE